MDITPQEALAIIEGYQTAEHGPVEFNRDVLKANLWDTQEQIIDAIFQYREVAVKSCNAVGKSYLAARAALTFLALVPGSLVVTTAPTKRQVEDVIWREMATAHKRAKFPLGGNMMKTRWEIDTDWFATGFTAKVPEKFFGFHSDYILVIIDEASGMEEPIYKGVRAITPNENAHTLYIGNPTNADGTFAAAFKNPRVKQFTISAFDSPNLKANNITDVEQLKKVFTPPPGVEPLDHKPKFNLPYPALISPTAVYERYMEWGIDNPFWQALIMAEFPDQPEDTLIPMNLILAAMDPELNADWDIEDGPNEYGGDIARYGSDRTVIIPRRGGLVRPSRVYTRQSTDLTTDRIISSMQEDGCIDDPRTVVRIDDSTMGGGVTDQLIRRKRDQYKNAYFYQVAPILFNQRPDNTNKFYDKRAEMYWTIRERFYNKNIRFEKKDMELAGELGSVRYEITPKGLIRIEQKDEIKKRTGKSPDKADALVLAFAKSIGGKFTMGEAEKVPVMAVEAAEQTAIGDPSIEEPVFANLMDMEM